MPTPNVWGGCMGEHRQGQPQSRKLRGRIPHDTHPRVPRMLQISFFPSNIIKLCNSWFQLCRRGTGRKLAKRYAIPREGLGESRRARFCVQCFAQLRVSEHPRGSGTGILQTLTILPVMLCDAMSYNVMSWCFMGQLKFTVSIDIGWYCMTLYSCWCRMIWPLSSRAHICVFAFACSVCCRWL